MISASIQPYSWDKGFPPISVTAVTLLINPQFNGTLDSGASFKYWLQDTDGVDLHAGSCELTSDQYDAWGSGDQTNYIMGCVLTNLTLTASLS